MKTEMVELFQTIRASLQPYAAMGFEANVNTEAEFQLVTERRGRDASNTPVFFSGIKIMNNHVRFCLFSDINSPELENVLKVTMKDHLTNRCMNIDQLTDQLLNSIELALSEGFKFYKEKGWV